GVGRGQFDRFVRLLHHLDSVLRLLKRGLHRVLGALLRALRPQPEDLPHAARDLRDGVAAHDIDGQTPLRRLAHLARLLLVGGFQGQHHIGIGHIAGDVGRDAAFGDGPIQAAAADAIRKDADGGGQRLRYRRASRRETGGRALGFGVFVRLLLFRRRGAGEAVRRRPGHAVNALDALPGLPVGTGAASFVGIFAVEDFADRRAGVLRSLHDLDLALIVADANLRARRHPAQQAVYRLLYVQMDGELVHLHDLDDDIEGRGGFALQHGLLRAAPLGLVVGERDGVDAADEVGERRVHHQVFEAVAVRRADQLHAALGDGARRKRLLLRADLVNHDHFRHVVFDGLDHDAVLLFGRGDLHPAGASDARMRNIAVARDLIAGVYDDDALLQFLGEDAGHFAQLGGLAATGPTEQQDALAALDDVLDDVYGSVDGAS